MQDPITRSEFEDLRNSVRQVRDKIYGNGEVGMITEIQSLKEAEARREKRDNRMFAILLAVGGALVSKILYDVLVFMPQLVAAVHQAPK
jgi:hypothetical protein